jgi:site-specific DNA recombinase
MSSQPTAIIRCAMYTRKSSEEGLEQSFNSLDAQREACEAFILSQRQEGWRVLPARYDDGGYSGGTMQRPALRGLLEDVEAHKVNVIVVYKVDRLTRNLADLIIPCSIAQTPIPFLSQNVTIREQQCQFEESKS